MSEALDGNYPNMCFSPLISVPIILWFEFLLFFLQLTPRFVQLRGSLWFSSFDFVLYLIYMARDRVECLNNRYICLKAGNMKFRGDFFCNLFFVAASRYCFIFYSCKAVRNRRLQNIVGIEFEAVPEVSASFGYAKNFLLPSFDGLIYSYQRFRFNDPALMLFCSFRKPQEFNR